MATDKQDASGGTGAPGGARTQGGGEASDEAGAPISKLRGNPLPKNAPDDAGAPASEPQGNLLPKNASGEAGAPVALPVPPGVRVVKASEFKAKCLQLMDEVAASGEEIIITKRGRPVSRLAPYREKSKLEFGRNRENIRSHGDTVAPMPPEWFEDGDAGGDLF